MKLKKWLALGLSIVMAGSMFALVACDETPINPNPPVGGDDEPELIDDSDDATEGLVYTEVVENNKTIGYSVGIGTAIEESSIYVPMMWDDLPVLSVGVEASTFLQLLEDSQFETMLPTDQITFMQQYTISYTDYVTEIHLPATLKYFGYGAFMQCTALQKIEIPKRITEIPDYTFQYNLALEEVRFASNERLDYIGGWAFYDCISLKKIELPDSLNEIDEYAFAQSGNYKEWGFITTGLETIDFGTGVSSIGEGAFHSCNALTFVNLPDSVVDLGDKAFYTCTALTTLRIGSGLRIIPNSAFWGCKALKTVKLTAPRRISEEAFLGCEALESIDFGESLEMIDKSAFWACGALKKVVLPDSIQTVGNAAFQACRALEEVTLGASIWDIGQYAFEKANGVMPEKIYYNGTQTEYAHVGGEGKPYASLVTFLK